MTAPIKLTPARNSKQQRTVFIVFASLVFPAVAFLSFLPSRDKYLLHTHGHYHSLGHLIVFGVVGFLSARAASSLRIRMVLFVTSLVFGAAIEFGEHLLFHAPVEWKDVLVDAAGVIGGTLIAILTAPE